MYYKYSIEELRTICRTHIENFERWARIFIHNILTEKLGEDYIHATGKDGNYRIKKDVVKHIDKMMTENPSRFPTPVDALFIEDIVYILCKDDFYRNYFSEYLRVMYPEGNSELRTFLSRLTPIRNKLSHTNPFSIREAEQCVCYSNDFIECIKNYYAMTGQDKEFNVPTIIRANDSLGNEYIIKEDNFPWVSIEIGNPEREEKQVFYSGEKFSLTLTIDPSFDKNTYTLEWDKSDGVEVVNNGEQINVTITNKLIGERVILTCKLITTNEWHRYSEYDQQLLVRFKALPHK